MTREERIEAARKAMEATPIEEPHGFLAEEAEVVLEAAFPEYFSGTHVLVPMSILQGPGRDDKFVLVPREPTEEMDKAWQRIVALDGSVFEVESAWEAMIAAYEQSKPES